MMADLLPNVTVPRKTMVDLYSATGIDAGTQIRVVNNGNAVVRLYTQADEPDPNVDGFIHLTPHVEGATSVAAQNEEGDSGAWVYCEARDGIVNVQVV